MSARQLIAGLPLTMRTGQIGRPKGGRKSGQLTLRGRSRSLPVAFGAEFDVQRAQVLPPEIVQRRELILATRVIQPPDGQFTALSVDQPEEPPGGQGLGDVPATAWSGPDLPTADGSAPS